MKQSDLRENMRLDAALLFILFLLAIVSCVAIAGATPLLSSKVQHINFAAQQVMWFGIGSVAIAFVMILDYTWYKKVVWYLYGFGMILLIGLELNIPLIGEVVTNNGATAWYVIPKIGQFQPSELMKVIMILLIGTLISNHHEKFTTKTGRDDLWLLAKIFLVALPPLALIAKQPDLGHVMVISVVIAGLILVSGIRIRYILTLVGIVVGVGAIAVFVYFRFEDYLVPNIIKPYQLSRFYGWLAPNEYPDYGYQLVKGLLSTGSGGLFGTGFQNTGVAVPEAQTDFIFSVIANQWGFVGASIVISLFFLLIYRMIRISLDSNEPFGSYICTGIVTMIAFQVFQNIGMGLGLLPITGITLPFLSYGGTSLLTFMIAIGFVLNVHSRTRSYMFESKED